MQTELNDSEIRAVVAQLFPENKVDYFTKLGIEMKEALALHKEVGLWELKDGKLDKANITAHCLLTTARVGVFADVLQLSDGKYEAMKGSASHDYFKMKENEITAVKGKTWAAYEEASLESVQGMHKAGFNYRTIRFASANGHGSLKSIEVLLNKPKLHYGDLECLIAHYVDDYTINDLPVSPVSDDWSVNDFDRRIQANKANPKYKILDEEGRQHFNGESTFEAQERIGHLVENFLAERVSQALGRYIPPKRLPDCIEFLLQKAMEL